MQLSIGSMRWLWACSVVVMLTPAVARAEPIELEWSAPDAVQDVFLVVLRKLHEFDGRHALKSWLFAIACRVARDYRRQQARQRGRREPLDESIRDHAPTPSEWSEQRDADRALTSLLDQLDERKRAVLILADIEELTAPEIAELTGLPLNTVYTRLRRARIELSAALAAQRRRST